ncbi:MAG: hypothetical protein LIP77_09430 [Planctomycetes bacterium]|nr:hypothetical protein [Planctomycetota bacterium]
MEAFFLYALVFALPVAPLAVVETIVAAVLTFPGEAPSFLAAGMSVILIAGLVIAYRFLCSPSRRVRRVPFHGPLRAVPAVDEDGPELWIACVGPDGNEGYWHIGREIYGTAAPAFRQGEAGTLFVAGQRVVAIQTATADPQTGKMRGVIQPVEFVRLAGPFFRREFPLAVLAAYGIGYGMILYLPVFFLAESFTEVRWELTLFATVVWYGCILWWWIARACDPQRLLQETENMLAAAGATTTEPSPAGQ